MRAANADRGPTIIVTFNIVLAYNVHHYSTVFRHYYNAIVYKILCDIFLISVHTRSTTTTTSSSSNRLTKGDFYKFCFLKTFLLICITCVYMLHSQQR